MVDHDGVEGDIFHELNERVLAPLVEEVTHPILPACDDQNFFRSICENRVDKEVGEFPHMLLVDWSLLFSIHT